MAILTDRLSQLMNQRAKWLSKRTQLIVENISNSELKNAKRKDIEPFTKILSKSKNAHTSTGRRIQDVKDFQITDNDIVTSTTEISREMEMLNLTRITADHDGLMSVIKNFHRMYRTILAKGG